MLHGQRVFRCGLPHARRHVVLVVARVSAVAVRRARGVISVTAVLMAAVLLGLGVFVPPLVRVDLVDALPGRHRAVVAVLLFFFFQGILNVIVVGLWRRFEQLLVESAQPLCPLGENLVSKKTYRLGWLFVFDFSGVCSIWQGFLKKFC